MTITSGKSFGTQSTLDGVILSIIGSLRSSGGKGAKAEQIVLHREDFDAIVEMLNEPPNAAIMERMEELMNRKAPWNDE